MEQLKANLSRHQAFSLLELLLVIAVLTLLLGLLGNGFGSVKQAFFIGSNAQSLRSAMLLAKQEAGSRNLPVEVRFCQTGATNDPVRYVQVVVHESNGTRRPLIRPIQYNDGIVIDSDQTRSTLFAGAAFSNAASSDPSLPGGIGTAYRVSSFFVRPGGATSLPPATLPSLLMRLERDTSAVPANYALLNIDPFTLGISIYRP